ncbi:MAG TPA: AAA family ATPase [Candidatus Binataceae bacterium]|nr:AAA family ATPase [Candidatus Binataceae bacterium]
MPQSGTITLLFTDLVSSTEHLQRAGDETGERLFRVHHKLINDAIEAGGGQELQWLGDGVLAAFSSTADAVRCAITMQQTAGRGVGSIKFEMRIGIHLGEVLRREGGYFGTPVVIARRLCDRGDSGQILCSRLVADLLSARNSFGFRDLGDLKLKGLATPIGVCEVIYERNDPVAMLTRTPFVGRAAQLKRLTSKLDEAFHGRGAITMLRGEAGIGKSRTLEEFSDHARQRGAVVLRGACYDGEWQSPYGPFAEAIVDYSHSAPRADFTAALGKRGSILARIAPSISDAIGDEGEPVSLDKDEERFRLFDAFGEFLNSIARTNPVLLILDDLHWADRGTVAMLNHVAHFIAASPILMIGAYRDAEVNRSHPLSATLATLSRIRNSETIALKGLHQDELATLLELIGDAGAPTELIEALLAATEGNPLFIRELLMHLVEERKILGEGQGWSMKLSVDELGIPEGVRQVIGTRLAKLSDEANRLLSVASAFNGSFAFDVAAAAAELDEQTALGALDEALDAQLLRPGANSEVFDFTHALIRHTLYSDLNPARRTRLHRRIAEEMERTWGERASHHAAEVAFQFWRGAAASGTERGAEYAISAADNAESAYDHDDVAAFLRIALELLPEKDRRRTKLLMRLASALAWTFRGEESVSIALEAASSIAASEGSDRAADYCESVARELLRGGSIESAWALAREGLNYIGPRRDITWASLDEIDCYRADGEDPNNPGTTMDTPRTRERRAVLRKISSQQASSRRIDQYPYDSREEILADPYREGIPLLLLAGDCRGSLPVWAQRAAEAERSGRIALAMDSWTFVARCQISLGDFAAARASYDRAIAMAARVSGNPLPLLNLLSTRFDFLLALDDGYDELTQLPGEAELFANPPPQFKWAFAAACATNALLLARRNLPEPALQVMPPAIVGLQRGAPWGLTYSLMAADLANVLWELNRIEHIDAIEAALRDKALRTDFRFPMRESRLSLARICALHKHYDEAVQWFDRSRLVLDEMGWQPLRAIVDYDQAVMYLRRSSDGDAARAQQYLKLAQEQFRRMGMTGFIKRVEALETGGAYRTAPSSVHA